MVHQLLESDFNNLRIHARFDAFNVIFVCTYSSFIWILIKTRSLFYPLYFSKEIETILLLLDSPFPEEPQRLKPNKLIVIKAQNF